MECVLLGSGGMMPMPYRMLTSLAVRLNGEIYLFDAGEGTQLNWKRLRLGVRGLRLIALTHLHADHCLGLPGLLMLKAQMETPAPVTLLGPPGTEAFIARNIEILQFHLNYALHVIEWTQDCTGPAYEDEQVRIYWRPLEHTRFCLGYRLEELEKPGRFNSRSAEALLVPRGPLWGMLQRGEKVLNQRGEEIFPEQVLGPRRRGRHVAFVVDTRPHEAILDLCRDVDLAFIEGMFHPEEADHASAKGHMTVVEAARMAHRSGARRAVFVHISPRYSEDDIPILESAAREHFEEVEMGKDLGVYPVELPE